MRAQVGDRIVLTGEDADGAVHDGEILQVRGEEGGPPYLVRWADGQESLVAASDGAGLQVLSAAGDAAESGSAAASGLLTAPSPVKEWQIRISLFEAGDDTTARIALIADAIGEIDAQGQARRGPQDPEVPRIGDEVALARALRRLSDQLLARATQDVRTVTGEDDVSIRPS
jgi:hypothetical protein